MGCSCFDEDALEKQTRQHVSTGRDGEENKAGSRMKKEME